MMACAIGQVLCGQEVAPVLACAPRAGQRDRALRLLGASRPGPLPHGLEGGGTFEAENRGASLKLAVVRRNGAGHIL